MYRHYYLTFNYTSLPGQLNLNDFNAMKRQGYVNKFFQQNIKLLR